ncbi:MAG: hypothetical protein HQ592_16730 [Planctomycetes bacterium]|nr:hypothetical protein [Planctomycetota bacterium]
MVYLLILCLVLAAIFLGTRWLPKKKREICIVHSKYDVPFNDDYKFPNDPPHVVRLQQETAAKAPGKTWVKVEYDVPVVGITKDGRDQHAARMIEFGNDRLVTLQRQPRNQFDPNAVLINAFWRDPKGQPHTAHIGYLPRELAANIAKKHPAAKLFANIGTMFRPIRGKSPGMRINVWAEEDVAPRKRTTKKSS